MNPIEAVARRRTEIGLGDLVRALRHLQPEGADQLDQIFQCLGFKASTSDTTDIPYRTSHGAWDRHRIIYKPRGQGTPDFHHKPALPPAPESPPDLPEQILDTELEILPPQTESTADVSFPENVKILPLDEKTKHSPPRLSLFPKHTVRAILSAAVVRQVSGRDLDFPRLIEAAVCQRPLRLLPTLSRFSTRGGCHLLLDFSDTLMPWWEDMRELMQQMRSVLGNELCQVYEFEGEPAAAIQWHDQRGETPWKPEPGRPVVLATDLGVVRHPAGGLRPAPESWRSFARLCRCHDAPVTAFVPLHHSQWPKGLDRYMRIIHWNPSTSAASVYRLLEEVCVHTR